MRSDFASNDPIRMRSPLRSVIVSIFSIVEGSRPSHKRPSTLRRHESSGIRSSCDTRMSPVSITVSAITGASTRYRLCPAWTMG